MSWPEERLAAPRLKAGLASEKAAGRGGGWLPVGERPRRGYSPSSWLESMASKAAALSLQTGRGWLTLWPQRLAENEKLGLPRAAARK